MSGLDGLGWPTDDNEELTVGDASSVPCSAWIDPRQRQPEYTGKYLVWTSEGPEILRVEEGFIEYADGNMADWGEISAWAEIPPPPL